MEVLSIVAAFGVGSILTATVQWILSRGTEEKNRRFTEKKEAYIGLLNSLHGAAIRRSDDASKEYALWQTRVDLVGSKGVRSGAQRMVDTVPGTAERNSAFEYLLKEMRIDLNVDKS